MTGSTLAPSFLVAMPQLRDPNFRRTVVLLVHHDGDGTFGVVLNRPTEVTAQGLCSTLDLDWRGVFEKQVGWGGPVQPQTGWLVFDDDDPDLSGEGVTPLCEGLSFAGSLEILRAVAESPPLRLQLLLGYAGWGPGQLEGELAEGAWLIAPVDPEVVFDVDPDGMWEHVVRSLGIEPSTLVASRGIH